MYVQGFARSSSLNIQSHRNLLQPRRRRLVAKLLALVSLGGEDDVVLEVEGGLGVALAGLEVHDQVVLDGEDGVGSQPGVVPGVELGGAALEVGVGDLSTGVSTTFPLSEMMVAG